jgi:hypothetical protein
MFDKTFKSETNFYSPETIEIKNAPTSDQIRLLREMEAELRKEILGAVHIDDNKFSSSIVCRHLSGSDKIEIVVLFTLNGNKFEVIESVCMFQYQLSIQEVMQNILKKMCSTIAENILRCTIMDNIKVVETIKENIERSGKRL